VLRPSQPGKWRPIAAVLLAECLGSFDATIFFTGLYPMVSEIAGSTDAATIGCRASLMIAMFMTGWGLGSVLFGMLADRSGPVKALMGSIILYSAATFACAFARDWTALAVLRLLVGIGIGAQTSVGIALLSRLWPGRSMLGPMGSLQLAVCAGRFLVGFFNLGFGWLGWRSLFFIGSMAIFLLPFLKARLSEPKDFMPNPLLLAFDKRNWSQILLFTVTASSALAAYWVGVSWIPAWINQLTGSLASAKIGAVTMYTGVGGIAGCLMALALIPRLGYKHMLRIGLAGSLVSALSLFYFVRAYSPLINVWGFAIGVCSAVPFVVISIRVAQIFPADMLGTASGIIWSLGRFMSAAVALCSGPMIQIFRGSYALSAATVTLVYMIGFLATFLMSES
jgi:predicted MFS family arabinose efflux permease